jgi:DNA-binding MarR family transcriptional regulator
MRNVPASRSQPPSEASPNDVDAVATSVLAASRALMGIAVRSIASVEDEVTLPQYRTLVLLTFRGEQNVSDLADALGVHPSTATRLCDRLVAKNLVERTTSSESRREIMLNIAPDGRKIVRAVSARRRREVRRIVERMSAADRGRLNAVFGMFAEAAGEIALPDDAWRLGWTT